PLGRFPRRMTVVALAGGGTAIYSAIALDPPEMARIEAMGAPSILIVPSDAHRMDAALWKQSYPELRVVAAPGAEAKVGEVVPGLKGFVALLEQLEDHVGADAVDHPGPVEQRMRFAVQFGQAEADPALPQFRAKLEQHRRRRAVEAGRPARVDQQPFRAGRQS